MSSLFINFLLIAFAALGAAVFILGLIEWLADVFDRRW